ncbi:MAG: thiamine diphosphokinase [Paracoccus sp. (in: a-proteobacteria)]|nr:thiamine diphosphokinase [Paracoccus sp. (in: a-proteobacteria)]
MIRFARPVTLIGGGETRAADLALALSLAPVLVAADGGADRALALGHRPRAAIGDFDSISEAARAAISPEGLIHIAEQDSTDFEKCLTRIDAPFVLAVGFTGARVDHMLAALSVLARRVGPPCLILGGDEVIFLAPPQLELELQAGTRVSLFPLGPARGRSTGLRWPIDGIEFTPAGRIGTSNEATGPVTLRIDGPMIVLLARDNLAAALRGMGL